MHLLLIVLSLFFIPFSLQAVDSTESHPNRPIVVFETTQGNFEVTLFPDVAPKAVENFLKHVQDNYYNGTTFHRVIKGFMVQAGDPQGNGTGGQSIWGKPFQDEFDPKINFTRPGLLAMANKGPNTNGSQFFITTAKTPWLNQKHTIFGEVTQGYDVVKKIESVRTGPQDSPLEKQKIIKITIKN